MNELKTTPRQPSAPVDAQFVERHSPRAFAARPVAPEMIASLFEAARWAPSSSNEQPWLFLYAADESNLARFRPLVNERNRRWADRAPLLMFVLARRHYARNGKPNDAALFDTGAAWMSLALQAHKLGLVTHAMGGILRDEVYAALNVPRDEYEVIAGVAVGFPGDPAVLPDDLRARETPSQRKPLSEVARAGGF